MHPLPGKCSVCGEALTVTRLHCHSCDTSIEGQFAIGRFERLSPEQLTFVENFVRCEGKINRMEDVVGLSYPTIRARLREVIRSLGYELGSPDDASGPPEDERRKVLDDLEQGRITSQRAVQLLHR